MSLTPEQIDVIQEMINIGVGQAANLLNSISGKHVKLSVPEVKVLNLEMLAQTLIDLGFEKNLSCVTLMFSGLIKGSSKIIFSTEQASKLVFAFTSVETNELDFDEIQAETLSEVGNIVLNSLVGSFANILNTTLNYSIPVYVNGNIDQILSSDINISEKGLILYARTHFQIENLQVEGDFILFIDLETVPMFIQAVNKFLEKGGFFN
ncbi:MAG: Chemotaxis protein CheC -- inhibitor of MCP methylation [Candidatus Kapaibacterium sp.]|nr:MAG: Chemotaxis protein CheC -- inhibitor of MCP methylation [Candidatus Kapabacteria bacterium]